MSDRDLDPEAPMDKPIGPPVPPMADTNAETYDPRHDLIYTRNTRGMVIQAIGSKGIPQDPKMLDALLRTLKDVDGAALGQLRIKSDEKGNEIAAQQAALVQEFMRVAHGRGLRERDPALPAPKPPDVDSIADAVPFVPGELAQGTINDNFENFSAATGGAIELAGDDNKD